MLTRSPRKCTGEWDSKKRGPQAGTLPVFFFLKKKGKAPKDIWWLKGGGAGQKTRIKLPPPSRPPFHRAKARAHLSAPLRLISRASILPLAFKRFPFNNFTYCLTLFSKFFSSFPHGTCSLSVSRRYLALDEIYHPFWAAFPSNPTLCGHPRSGEEGSTPPLAHPNPPP